MKFLYALRKNGKYLSGIFSTVGDGLEFYASNPKDSYLYNNKQYALDMAKTHNLDIVPVYQPNAPFGDYVEYKGE